MAALSAVEDIVAPDMESISVEFSAIIIEINSLIASVPIPKVS